ncbi:MAG: hypothetical protein JXB20_00120 [Bacilli bacterium]|nr:hypothetical protein [Bacilli bacterium]
MDIDNKLSELKKTDITPDNVAELQALQETALAEKNQPICQEATLLLAKYLDSIQEYDEAVEVLKKTITSTILDDFGLIVPLVDQLVGILLKIEDYQELLEVLKYRERFIEAKKSYQLMQKFYMAVCYEGLRQNEKAIATLHEVEDTISNNNLVSKYLKLAMLELGEGNLAEAKKMYEYAHNFDRLRNNPTFDLVASDLAYGAQDYLLAMELFQKYFLKAKAKFRYLDRFIYISLQLNNHAEALMFYEKYLPKVERQISKIAKIRFYEAGLRLFEKIGDYQRVFETESKLSQLSEQQRQPIDVFDDTIDIIRTALPELHNNKPRDLVLDMFRKLAEKIDFKRLLMIYVDQSGFRTMTYQKGLLMEKTLAFDIVENTILDTIMSSENMNQLHRQDSEHPFLDYDEAKTPLDVSLVTATLIEQPVYPKAHIVCMHANTSSFDKAQRLLQLGANVLAQKLTLNASLVAYMSEMEPYARLLEKLQIGLLRLEGEQVRCLNPQARSLLGLDLDVSGYKDIQKRMVMEKPLYIDDFLSPQKHIFAYRSSETSIIKLEAISWVDRQTIYIGLKKAIEQSKTEVEHNKPSARTVHGLRPFESLMIDLLAIKPPYTLGLVLLENFRHLMSMSPLTTCEKLFAGIKDTVERASRQYLLGIYEIGVDSFVSIWKTVDKRIIDRIARTTKYASYIDTTSLQVDLSISAIQVQRPEDPEGLIKNLVQWGYCHKEAIDGAAYYERQEVKRFGYLASIAAVLRELIDNKKLEFVYQPIGNWHTGEYVMLEVKPNTKQIFGSESEIFAAISQANLVVPFFDLFLRKLAKKLDKPTNNVVKKIKFTIRIPMSIPKTEHLAQTLGNLIGKLKLAGRVIIVPELQENDYEGYLKFCRSLREFGLLIAFSKLLQRIELDDLALLDEFAYGEITPEETKSIDVDLLGVLLAKMKGRIIYDHGNEELRRSFLKDFEITFVKGSIYPVLTTLDSE